MTVDEVEGIIEQTMDGLPEAIIAALLDVNVFVASDRQDMDTLRLAVTAAKQPQVVIPQNFRAVFIGTPVPADAASSDEDEGYETDLASGVFIFNAALLQTGEDVVFTLMHEIGHALGLDEEEVAALGLE